MKLRNGPNSSEPVSWPPLLWVRCVLFWCCNLLLSLFSHICSRDSVVLGAIAQDNNYSKYVSVEDRRHIYEGCFEICPSLKDAEIIGESVGLRPGRTEIRLERDIYITSKNVTYNRQTSRFVADNLFRFVGPFFCRKW